MAVVSSTNERNISARVGKAADTPFIPTLRLDATEPLANIVAKLNQWSPEALVAYASMAYFLANEQEQGRLRIHPRFIFTASEVLTAQMREVIENVWGKVVFDEYVSTETATIAAEDEFHHGMHIFEDLLIIESVDEHNNPVPLGMYGSKILATTLFSRTQPLIRYEISDSIRLVVDKIPCRLPYSGIDDIQGRQEDMLTTPGLHAEELKSPSNVFHDVMDIIPNKGWQIIQERILSCLLIDG
jgi:phenylacetate-coenzyme A ligase PaaK-like adenylate-forming protein